MKRADAEKTQSRIQELTEDNNVLLDDVKEMEIAIGDLKKSIGDEKAVNKKYMELVRLDKNLRSKIKEIAKELQFYKDHDDCPICKQGIAHDFKEGQIIEKNQKKAQIETSLQATGVVIKKHQERLNAISKIEEQIQEINFKISEIRAEIKMSKNALITYKKDLDNAQKEVDEVDTSKIDNLQKKLNKQVEIRTKLLDEHEVLNIVQTILRDGGIKAKIIAQYIPVINKLINKYLAAFDLFVDFQLDEEFNEVIRSRFRDKFTYASFSEGEKLRITLSIMLAWRSVAKLRSSVSTNLLILDETLDGALDGVGIESLIETLHGLNSDDNIFVISHRGDQFAEKFENNLKFEKLKNFSELAA